MIYLDFKFVINWSTLVALVIGIILGAILFFLIYLLATLHTLKNSSLFINNKIKEIKEEDVKKEIEIIKDNFILETKKKDISFEILRKNAYQLIYNIAKLYYPKSKNPLYELSLDELLKLDQYIINKLEIIMEKRGLKPLKQLKIKHVMALLNIKEKYDHNKIVEVNKKYKISTILSHLHFAFRILNPASWFNKFIVNPSLHLIIKKICLLALDIIGEETYHTFSKQIYLTDVSDQEVNELLEILSEDETVNL